MQSFTPNREIYKFPYANEFVLEECERRGIEVNFGLEMTAIRTSEKGVRTALFKNVDSGEVIEHDFHNMCINPPSRPYESLREGGLTD